MAPEPTQPISEMNTRNISCWGGGLTTLPHSYADSLEILGASTSWNSQALFRTVRGMLCFTCFKNLQCDNTPTDYITHITGKYFSLFFSFSLSERNTDFSAGTLQAVWLLATGYTVRGSKAGRGENFCTRPD